MTDFKPGDAVLIRAVVLRRLSDNRLPEDRGWLVETTRGTVMVEPGDIVKMTAEQVAFWGM